MNPIKDDKSTAGNDNTSDGGNSWWLIGIIFLGIIIVVIIFIVFLSHKNKNNFAKNPDTFIENIPVQIQVKSNNNYIAIRSNIAGGDRFPTANGTKTYDSTLWNVPNVGTPAAPLFEFSNIYDGSVMVADYSPPPTFTDYPLAGLIMSNTATGSKFIRSSGGKPNQYVYKYDGSLGGKDKWYLGIVTVANIPILYLIDNPIKPEVFTLTI